MSCHSLLEPYYSTSFHILFFHVSLYSNSLHTHLELYLSLPATHHCCSLPFPSSGLSLQVALAVVETLRRDEVALWEMARPFLTPHPHTLLQPRVRTCSLGCDVYTAPSTIILMLLHFLAFFSPFLFSLIISFIPSSLFFYSLMISPIFFSFVSSSLSYTPTPSLSLSS